MRVGLISDIHGNLPALEAVVPRLRSVDQVLCLGDIVNYAPWNDECLELAHTLPGFQWVEGNHETLFLHAEHLSEEIPLVQAFYHASFRRFSRVDLIRNLPTTLDLHGAHFTHTLEGRKIYINTEISGTGQWFIGHSHQSYCRTQPGFRLVNPGSVGQNRAQIRYAEFALWDTDSDALEFVRTEYDFDRVIAEMRAQNYPEECLRYYLSKA